MCVCVCVCVCVCACVCVRVCVCVCVSQLTLRRQQVSEKLSEWWVFGEKYKELCEWLTTMESKVSHNGDVSIEEMIDKLRKVRRSRIRPLGPDRLGQTAWVRPLVPDRLGQTAWTRPLGDQTAWIRPLGSDRLDQTAWIRPLGSI